MLPKGCCLVPAIWRQVGIHVLLVAYVVEAFAVPDEVDGLGAPLRHQLQAVRRVRVRVRCVSPSGSGALICRACNTQSARAKLLYCGTTRFCMTSYHPPLHAAFRIMYAFEANLQCSCTALQYLCSIAQIP